MQSSDRASSCSPARAFQPSLARLRIPGLIALLIPCAMAFAQSPPAAATPFVAGGRIPLLQGEIAIDGNLDDAAWQGALVQEIPYDIDPGDNAPAPEYTLVRLGYTADALYVAFHARDHDPAAIRAHLRDRDSAFQDDWVGVFLDTFDDNRRGYELIVNPLGVQADLIRDETNIDNQEDESWDGLWSSAGRLTGEGYDVEMRIPFATLRFPAGAGDQKWGISLFRNYPRDKRHQLASHRSSRGSNCFQCEWAGYEGMAGARQGRNLEIVPTLTMSRAQARDAADASWHSDSDVEPGLDLSWSPAPSMTLNATLNPDFSQVETDALQLNINDSFALFYDEKRPFFLEGADYFTSQFNVLYTRQIADPDAGLRVTGRAGGNVYGALVARDASTLVLVPGVLGSSFRELDQDATVAAGRYRYNLGERASIGAIGTFREGDDYANKVGGLDARWQQGAHTATAQILRSTSEYPVDIVAAYADELGDDATPTGNAWRAAYKFNNRRWNFDAWHEDIDPGFRADLGFMGQVGYDKSLLGGQRTWYRDGKSVNRIQLYGDYDVTHRYDGQLLEREWEASINGQGPMQSNFQLHGMTRQRFWRGGLFNERYLDARGEFRPLPDLLLGVYMTAGHMLDLTAARTGRRQMIELWGNTNLGRGLNIGWDLTHQRLQRDGGTAFRTTVLNANSSWQVTPRQRLRLTLQAGQVVRDPSLYADPVNRKASDWATQLVYSWKLNPRTALYAGGSYGGFRDDEHPDVFGNARTVFMKLGYGWQPKF